MALRKSEYFFSRGENEPYTPDPNLTIAEGRVQISSKEKSEKLQALLRGAALRGQQVMQSYAPKNTEALANSIRINPPIVSDPDPLFVQRGGFNPGLPVAGRGRGPGGASRRIEVLVGGPSKNKSGDAVNVDYANLVLDGQLQKDAPVDKKTGKKRYFVFTPYGGTARAKIFEKGGSNQKKLYPDTRGGIYNRDANVIFASSRNAIPPNRKWLDLGVAEANKYVSDRIGKIL